MFDGVTAAGAAVMHLDGYGLAPGKHADLVVLQARSPVEAIRLRATRLYVLRRGEVVARSAPQSVALTLGESSRKVDFLGAAT